MVSAEKQENTILNKPAVDMARLILKDKYEKMVDLYIASSQTHINTIMQALKTGNIAQAVRPAHTLKSASMQMGALALSGVARQIERLSRAMCENGQGDVGEIAALADQAAALLPETRQALENSRIKKQEKI